jgi:hypothetical protein
MSALHSPYCTPGRAVDTPSESPLGQSLQGERNVRCSVVVALEPEPSLSGTTVVVGGSLVRAPFAKHLGPGTCELSDAGGRGWHYRAGGTEMAWAAHEERLGCL